MKVKICGVTNSEDAMMCEALGADAIGFVHLRGRSRSVELKDVREMCSAVGPLTLKVLVCAPKDVHEALRMLEASGADALQLHSLEPGAVSEIRDSGVTVFRVIPPIPSEALRYAESADALVFEDGRPGTGCTYDYAKVPTSLCRRAIIAGGLNPENLELAKAVRPYGLDVSSGVESSPGRKDSFLVSSFIRRAKK